MPGGNLEDCSDLTEAIELAAYQALRRIHSLGIAHGDIRLENFMLLASSPAKVVIVDFGCSRFADAGAFVEEEDELEFLIAEKLKHQ